MPEPDFYPGQGDQTERMFRLILWKLARLERYIGEQMSAFAVALTTLTTAVQADTTQEAATLTFIQGVPDLITAGINNALALGATPAQLQMLADAAATINGNDTAIAAAIKANTPAGPVVVVPPVIVPVTAPPVTAQSTSAAIKSNIITQSKS
jgi:hypothetical protein